MSSPRRAPAAGGRSGAAPAASPAGSAPAAASPAAAAGGSPDGGASENADADDLDRAEEESEGEDLLDEDNYAADYEARPELDQYEAEGIDEDEEGYEQIDPRERARAEARMAKRDRETMRKSGRQGTAMDSPLDDEPDAIARRRRRIRDGTVGVDADGNPVTPASGGEGEAGEDAEQEDQPMVNLDNYQGPLAEWIALESTRNEIRRQFRQFLSEYKGDSSVAIYPSLMVQMGRENRASLEVSFLHLSDAKPVLAIWVADEPEKMLEIFDEEATNVTFSVYPEYSHIQQNVHVRITALPIVDKLRHLRQSHLNCLIRVEGVVTRRSGVFPQLQLVTFNCIKCRAVTGPYTQNSTQESRPTRCPECQSPGPFSINTSETIYRNYQKITLQESPGSVPAGRVPRQKDVILLHDLIDSVSPGEMVDVTAVYKHTFDPTLNTKNGFPVFQTILQANYVSKHAQSMASFKLTDEDKEEILALSRNPNIAKLVVNSIGPSIYGHEDIKMALALAMFSGEAKQFENGHRIRGDINVLVLGDPGTAKSQFLKYAEKTSHRAVYTTGKGASAVGLTASVHKDHLTREWTLEGGALVLADQGICLIDEFDKMNDQDRTSIHEAMEQQSISISKAGIITTLKARCSVIAAANPVMGRYDSSKTFAENVELTDAILSRFDILCVVRDKVDFDVDNKLANFVVGSHMAAREHNSIHGMSANGGVGAGADLEAESKSNEEIRRSDPSYGHTNMLSQSILKKYIMYARTHCHPKLTRIDHDKISQLYAELRRESMVTGGIPIAVRHIESIIRMSEAHAKMHLRDMVAEEDVNVAIGVMLESFISSQKFAVMRPLRQHFERFMARSRDQFELLLFTLQQQVQEQIDIRMLKGATSIEEATQRPIDIRLDEFKAKVADLNITQLEPFLQSDVFKANNFSVNSSKQGWITKRFQH